MKLDGVGNFNSSPHKKDKECVWWVSWGYNLLIYIVIILRLTCSKVLFQSNLSLLFTSRSLCPAEFLQVLHMTNTDSAANTHLTEPNHGDVGT